MASYVDNQIVWLQRHGFPARPEYVRHLVRGILKEKGSTHELGKDWLQKFCFRHPEVKKTMISPRDYRRAMQETRGCFQQFYNLYRKTVDDLAILPEDIWNMDEKGCMAGIQGKSAALVHKYEPGTPFKTQNGSRKWTTMIEGVSQTGAVLDPFIIFKEKKLNTYWVSLLRQFKYGHIQMSENGWTNDEIGFQWLTELFEPQTSLIQKGKWRLILYDGHSSHISSKFIRYAVKKEIILLCLPSHTTHKLQPLDVGLFGPFAMHYQRGLEDRARYGGLAF